MGIADLNPLDQLYLAYLISEFVLIVAFTAWFIARLDRIAASDGSLDLFLNYSFRLFPLLLVLFLLWALLDFLAVNLFSL